MEQLYQNGQPIILGNLINSGEEADIYEYQDRLVKIYKKERRKNLDAIDSEFLHDLTNLHLSKFYLPLTDVYNLQHEYRGYTMLRFINSEVASHAQRANIRSIILELEKIEQEIKILSNMRIQIRDMKLAHILYNKKYKKLGIIDCGLFRRSSVPNLYIENLKTMNYFFRQALLWANYEGTCHEMLGIDFPEIYDTLDEGAMTLSEILKQEIKEYDVPTLEKLKHRYQGKKFY